MKSDVVVYIIPLLWALKLVIGKSSSEKIRAGLYFVLTVFLAGIAPRIEADLLKVLFINLVLIGISIVVFNQRGRTID